MKPITKILVNHKHEYGQIATALLQILGAKADQTSTLLQYTHYLAVWPRLMPRMTTLPRKV